MNRRNFLTSAAATVAATPAFSAQQASAAPLDSASIARRHAIVNTVPTPSFFEGALLGNGDVGVCVTLRPDALGLHIGKEDSWDIRVSEDHYQHVLHFDELLKLWERAGEEAKRQGHPEMTYLEDKIDFLRDYTQKVSASYRKPWPRPWPCGIVWIHWDPRRVRLVKQTLDPSDGLYTAEFLHDDLKGKTSPFRLHCFVNRDANHICVWAEAAASGTPVPIESVIYVPNHDPEALLPNPEVTTAPGSFESFQRFPATAPTESVSNPSSTPEDSAAATISAAFAKSASSATAPTGSVPDPPPTPEDSSFALAGRYDLKHFRLDVALLTPRDAKDNRASVQSEVVRLSAIPARQLQRASAQSWRAFWSKSAVDFEDRELERIWYHNQYFLACCLREGKLAPGLFGNWSSGQIGTAWHGDYHMNYNTQQVWWGVFSSNHVEQHLPYVELCEKLTALGESYAKEKFGLPGAFFFHSAYPVPSKVNPYPAPPWGYEVCETPWTVQSLWWHYLYTQDRVFLERAYPMLRSASRFLAAYVKKLDDGKYHIIPTVSPENWGFTVDMRLNKDCIIDVALSEFVLKATAEAAGILGKDGQEREHWVEIGTSLAPYPTVEGPFGKVWLDVPGAPAEWIYNVPVTLAPVFPGEQVGLGKGEKHLEIAQNSAKTVRLEGGNDLVYLPLIKARLGQLDVAEFKREVKYCQLPNGISNDRVRQTGGRYAESTDFDFMMRMGVWTENLSLPAVLNECLLQSFSGTLRLFPNTTNLGKARFRDLRAAGAFLVSAQWDGHTVSGLSILSEKGVTLRLFKPWGGEVQVLPETKVEHDGDVLVIPTRTGTRYTIRRA
jgi:alpha-L-fucosidase 2